MATWQAANFIETKIALPLTAGGLSLTVDSVPGELSALTITTDSFVYLVLEQGSRTSPTKREIVKCTGRSGSVLTIVRAQDGTSAQAFDPGDRVAARLVNAMLADIRDSAAASALKGQRFGFYANGIGSNGYTTGGETTNAQGAASQATAASGGTQRAAYVRTTATAAGPVERRQAAIKPLWIGDANDQGGMDLLLRWGLDNVASSRAFNGVNDSTGAIATGDPSALTNMFGVGYDQADSNVGNWFFMHNNAAGTAVRVDSGVPRDGNAIFELSIVAANGIVTLKLTNTSTKATNSLVVSSELPSAATALCWHIWGDFTGAGSHVLDSYEASWDPFRGARAA